MRSTLRHYLVCKSSPFATDSGTNALFIQWWVSAEHSCLYSCHHSIAPFLSESNSCSPVLFCSQLFSTLTLLFKLNYVRFDELPGSGSCSEPCSAVQSVCDVMSYQFAAESLLCAGIVWRRLQCWQCCTHLPSELWPKLLMHFSDAE